MSLIGLIGVGKSMLINILLDLSVQETTGTRDYDGKGRHKTTVCQIFVLPGGAFMIDNPGLRERESAPLVAASPIRSRTFLNVRAAAGSPTAGMSRSRAVR